MKITYIHHSSFLVELEHKLLLFDYFDGTLPPMDPDKELIVFASHRHGDHFSPVIFDLAHRHPRIFYVLSDDIWQNRVPDEHRGHVIFVDPGAKLDAGAAGDLHLMTFKSTDEGVAFWITCEGVTIYHAGDLNHWKWAGESDPWNHNMGEAYHRELAKIKELGVRPDVAFLPLDGRLKQWFYLGLQEFMEQIGAKWVFPMHFWEDYTWIDRLTELPLSEPYRHLIARIHQEGQSFERL